MRKRQQKKNHKQAQRLMSAFASMGVSAEEMAKSFTRMLAISRVTNKSIHDVGIELERSKYRHFPRPEEPRHGLSQAVRDSKRKRSKTS